MSKNGITYLVVDCLGVVKGEYEDYIHVFSNFYIWSRRNFYTG